MKKMQMDNKGNIITRFMVEKYFEDFYKSIVVLANPKTVLYDKYAKKEVRDKVIRVDQLVNYIKDACDKCKEIPDSEEKLLAKANFYLSLHKETLKDYTAKYERYRSETAAEDDVKTTKPENISAEESGIFKELKSYRWEKSREENVKPYFLYNDRQLMDLISKMPKDRTELLKVAGFGEIKADKYGEDIIKIIDKYRSS